MEKNISERFSLENQRINIFIGSTSGISEVIAHAIKSHFDEERFNVDVWDEDVFEPGKSNLQNLKKFTAIYDFAIMVFVNDYVVFHQEKIYDSIPPNIIFEYGLFLGRMGASRSFIIAEKGVKELIDKSFSGLKGITIGKAFEMDAEKSKEESVKPAAEYVKREILENYQFNASVSFLPSAALAIGYFNNFLSQVSQIVYDLSNDDQGVLHLSYGRKKESSFKTPFFLKNYKIVVIIPDILLDSGYDGGLERKIAKYGLVDTDINTERRKRPFGIYWKKQTEEEVAKDGFVFYDFPTTLDASQKIIELMLRDGQMNEKDADIEEIVGEKEIFNFIKTLKYKLRTTEKVYMRSSIEIVSDPDGYFKNKE